MPQSMREFLENGPATSKEIQNHTGYSQPVVARKLKALGNDIVRLQDGRSPKYALTRNAFGADNKLALVMVDAYGNTVIAAHIRPLAPEGFYVEPATGMPSVFLGQKRNGLYDDLPYFLQDLCPQGFIGRQIAKNLASQQSEFPSDPRNWNTNHIGCYLISNGDDLPGNLKLGPNALLRLRRHPETSSEEDYPLLANNVISGEVPGSSAGGEQPKFTTFCRPKSAHVIVKFSPKGDNDVSRRWRDILITEFHATEALHSFNIPAAETRLLELDGRLFLESERFDRSGEFGRMPLISLQAIDSEFTGFGDNWLKVMTALQQKQLVSWQHVYDTVIYWGVGKLINNSDMHLGNLSFAAEGDFFRLLPVYDMCSMGFAPKGGGEVAPYEFAAKMPDSYKFTPGMIKSIINIARDFWERVANDSRISNELKEFLERGNPIDFI